MVERPMATVMANLPREDVVVIEQNWHETHEHGRVVSMSGFLTIPEELVPRFEKLSGVAGVFARCIARHRSTQEGPLL
eukprot:37773-Alexandrium_andersonii.AAC.1